MTTRPAVDCNGPSCDSSQTGAAGATPPLFGWLRVVAREPDVPAVLDFCGWDCVLRFAGQLQPNDVQTVEIRPL